MRPVFDVEQAEAFFGALFNGTTHTVELRSLPGCGPYARHWTLPEHAAGWTRYYWDKGTDTRFGVTPRVEGGGLAEHIPEMQLFYADIDDVTNLAKDRIRRLAPTAIVSSGRGLHVYWRLCSPMPARLLPEWLRIEGAIVRCVGGDPAAKDPVRMLRVPGTYNFKRRKPVVLQEIAPENTYSVDSFVYAFDVSTYAMWRSRNHAVQATIRASGQVGTLEPPEDLRVLLDSVRWRWRWQGTVALLAYCPACEIDRRHTGGSEHEKAWIDKDFNLKCWRTKCPASYERYGGPVPQAAWWPWVEELRWAKLPK